MKKLIALAVLLWTAMPGIAGPQNSPVPPDTAVRTGKLPNGLTYYIRHNGLPERRADFYIAQRVGSVLEEENQRGLAHFLEHMAFAGTENFPDKTLTGYLERNGIKFGANLNAYTSIDETVYKITDVPTARSGLLDSCLLILRDWSGRIALEGEAIERERKIIHEEWRTRRNATNRMYDSLLPKLYPNGSRYADRMPIGSMEVVDHFPHEALRKYYRQWYRPDLQAIIVVGDIDPDRIEARIRTLWQDASVPEDAPQRTYFPVGDNVGPLAAVATDPEATASSLAVFYKHDKLPPERSLSTEALDRNYQQSVYALMLGSRLSELTQQADPPFVYAGFFDTDYLVSKTKGAYQLFVSFENDRWKRALEAAVTELKRAREYGFTEDEYERARDQMISSYENSYNERDKTRNVAYVHQCLANFLNDHPLVSKEYLYEYYKKRIPQMTLDSLNEAFRTMFPEHNVALMLTGPRKDSLNFPTEKELVEAYREAYKATVTPYKENLDAGSLLGQEPQPGQIVSERTDPDYGTTVWTLGNGARVVIKPTDFRSDEILMQAVSAGGTSAYPESDSLYMSLNAGSALVGGFGRFSLIDLNKKVAGKRLSINPYVTNSSEGVSGACSPKDFDELLQLVHLAFTQIRRDTTLFETWRSKTRTALSNQKANPALAMADSTNRLLYGESPRYRRMTAERVGRLDYDRTLELYRQRFADAGDFTFVFVGNIDTAAARPAVERYIASLPGGGERERATPVDFILPGSRTLHFDREMETPKSTVEITITVPARYTLRKQVELTFLKQVLDIVYVETIRTEEGGTYGVQTRGSLLQKPYDRLVFTVRFDTNAEQADSLATRVLAELKKTGDEGPSAASFDKVKEYLLKAYEQSIRENGYWREHMASLYLHGTDSHTDYLKTLNGIAPKDIARLARDIYDSPNRVEVIMNGVTANTATGGEQSERTIHTK